MGKMLPQIEFPNAQEQTEFFEKGISLHFPSKSKDVENPELRAAWRKIETDALKSVREFLSYDLQADLKNSNTDEESLVVDYLESPGLATAYRGELRKDLLDINPQQAAREARALEQTTDEAILAELEEELKDRYFGFIIKNIRPLAEERASTVGLEGDLKEIIANKILIKDVLGKGNFGDVYGAYHYLLDKEVAFKVQSLAGITTEDRERFLREVRSLALFDHPNILKVFTAEIQDDLGVIVTELVRGQSLEGLFKAKGRLPLMDEGASPGIATILIATSNALKALHENKDETGKDNPLIHRDVKPDNIFLGEDGSVKLGDFGLTRSLYDSEMANLIKINKEAGLLNREYSPGGNKRVTDKSSIMGTPYFLAPEIIGDPPYTQPKSDIFSLGVVAWQMISGVMPFEAKNVMDVLEKITDEERSEEELPEDIPIEVRRFIVKMLEKKPENRPSASEVAAFFENLQKSHVLGKK